MEPASIRYKNPGAMWGKGNKLTAKWGSTHYVNLSDGLGQGNNIAVFDTYVDGICAQIDLWRTSAHYKNKKFSEAIHTWSGGNATESYIAFVLKRVPGMKRDTVINDAFWHSGMAVPFLKAQAWHEAGKQYPAPDADFEEALRRVLGAGHLVTQAEADELPEGEVPEVPKDEDPDERGLDKAPWYKKVSTWVGGSGLAAAGGGAAMTIDWMTIAAFAIGLVVVALVYTYAIPPRGQLKKW